MRKIAAVRIRVEVSGDESDDAESQHGNEEVHGTPSAGIEQRKSLVFAGYPGNSNAYLHEVHAVEDPSDRLPPGRGLLGDFDDGPKWVNARPAENLVGSISHPKNSDGQDSVDAFLSDYLYSLY